MPKFKHVADETRTYPHVSIEAAPGDVIDVPENPDPLRWAQVDSGPVAVADEQENN
jgi:hypothetical protein